MKRIMVLVSVLLVLNKIPMVVIHPHVRHALALISLLSLEHRNAKRALLVRRVHLLPLVVLVTLTVSVMMQPKAFLVMIKNASHATVTDKASTLLTATANVLKAILKTTRLVPAARAAQPPHLPS